MSTNARALTVEKFCRLAGGVCGAGGEQSYVDAFAKDASALGAWIGPLRDVVAQDPSVLTDDRLRYGQIADAISDWRILDVALTLADELPAAPPAPSSEAHMWPVVAEVQDALVYPDGVIEAPIAIAGPVAAEPVPAACRKKAKDVSDVVQDTMHGPHCMRVERREEKGTDLARERDSDVMRGWGSHGPLLTLTASLLTLNGSLLAGGLQH